MPTSTRERLLSRYHYDPLDRLVNSTPFEQLTQRYYCKSRFATEIQGGVQRTIVQHEDQLLAQQQSENGKTIATLLATDQQRSVLNALNANQPNSLAYSPYGHRPLENGLLSLLGFNGERPDPVTGHYHLGNGYRQFNPVLMRFNSPDSWSPFGEGGLNAYGYCGGDPRNRYDPSGHVLKLFIPDLNKAFKLEIPRPTFTFNKAASTTKNAATPAAPSTEKLISSANKTKLPDHRPRYPSPENDLPSGSSRSTKDFLPPKELENLENRLKKSIALHEERSAFWGKEYMRKAAKDRFNGTDSKNSYAYRNFNNADNKVATLLNQQKNIRSMSPKKARELSEELKNSNSNFLY